MRNRSKYPLDDPRVIACKRAIDAAGGIVRVARVFGLSKQAVHQWDIVAEERCVAMAAISGVSIHELRPDIFIRGKARKAG
jgi:DNA-binding transcriptional regulator YdaS (Cro superfamily)